jgi:hypothetical protein
MSLVCPFPRPHSPSSILSLDVSSVAVGWASWTAQGRASGVLDLKSISDLWVRRADLYCRWLTGKINELRPDLIVIEQPFGGMANGAESIAILHHLHRQTHLIGYRVTVHVRDVTRPQVVKALLGWSSKPVDPDHKPRKGTRPKMRGASKHEVLEAINARCGSRITSHDEADAVAGLEMVLAELAGTGAPADLPYNGTDLSHVAQAEPTPPAQQVLQLEQIKGRTRTKLERQLAAIGLGAALSGAPKRKARGRRPSPL